MTKNDPKPKIGHILCEGRFWITVWGHFGRFGAPKVAPKCDKNEVEKEVGKKGEKNKSIGVRLS